MESKTSKKELEKVKFAFESEDVPKQYFNGFSNTVGPGDIIMTLFKNGKPFIVLNTSYTVAKSLSQGLLNIIKNLEKNTNNEIMTINYISQKMKMDNEENKEDDK